MSDSPITAEDFEQYVSMVNSLSSFSCELALCDVSGAPLLSSVTFDSNVLSSLINAAATANARLLAEGSDRQQPVQVHKTEHNKSLYCLTMIAQNEQPLGMLGMLVNHQASAEEELEYSRLVENLSVFIKKEYALCEELNNMALELSDRYEELNLVYDTDRDLQGLDDLHNSLKQIVENCVTYLNVGAAVLSLPTKNIKISHCSKHKTNAQSQALIEEETDAFFQIIKDSGSSLVLNSQDEIHALIPGSNCKILCSPITGLDDRLDGILVTAKDLKSIDYTNSDRNLLEVMSKKVIQLVQVNYDALTGLFNRTVYEQHVEKSLQDAHETDAVHSVLSIDLDDLQVINETFSHQVGDNLIKTVADLVRKLVRDTDVVARTGGDEFGVLLENCEVEAAEKLARRIHHAIGDLGYIWDGKQLEISATIGVAIIDNNTENMAGIVSESELALKAAKELGKNRVHVFHREDGELVKRKQEMRWVSRIKTALQDNRFIIYAQPIVPIQNNSAVHHFEVLLRLRDEEDNILAPFAFMPAAERYNLMPDIDRWVIKNTLFMISEQLREYPELKINVAINLSGQSLGHRSFLDFTLQQLDQLNFPLQNICFEITESAAIANLTEAQHFMAKVRAKGCQFSLDDFGTGLSSFAYLKNLPVDYLKIDGCFVKEILEDPISVAMVSAINQVGHVMGLKTIAEFVENEAIRDLLKELNIDYAQGYGVGMPRPLSEQLEEMRG